MVALARAAPQIEPVCRAGAAALFAGVKAGAAEEHSSVCPSFFFFGLALFREIKKVKEYLGLDSVSPLPATLPSFLSVNGALASLLYVVVHIPHGQKKEKSCIAFRFQYSSHHLYSC